MKSRRGSAHVIIIVTLVITLIAALGWIFWQNFSDYHDRDEKQETEKIEDTVSEEEPSLSIKEWGVKIPLSSESKGVYYKLSEDIEQDIDNPTYLTVFSDRTDALVGPAGISCEGEYIAYLLRLPSDSEKWQLPQTIDDGKVSSLYTGRITVGEYRYAIATHKQYGPSCFATNKTGDYIADEATSQKFDDVVSAFEADFNNIQAN